MLRDMKMKYKVDHLGIAHLTGPECSLFDGGVVVAADDVIAAKLLGVEFDQSPLKQGLFTKQITPAVIIDTVRPLGKKTQFGIEISTVHTRIVAKIFKTLDNTTQEF